MAHWRERSPPAGVAWIQFRPGARFSKAPETCRVRKAIFSSSVHKNGEVYTPEISCMKEASDHFKNL